MLTPKYIDNNDALNELCISYANAPFLAIDTEFVRERTYYAALGLIQVYDGKTLALIDPLVIDDLSPFWQLMVAPHIVKVLHAGSEDFEVFKHYGDVIPSPLFDSQVAASLVGLGASLGYAKLVEEFCEISLDKGESRTNWLARPLSDSQLSYAANDVYYLHQLYPVLKQRLIDADKVEICQQECQRLANKSNAKNALDKYLDISNAWQLEGQQLAILKALAAWRQYEAIKRNLAQGFVIKDGELFLIAKFMPTSNNALRTIEALHPMLIKRHGKKILSLVEQTIATKTMPEKLTRLVDYAAYKKTFKAIKSIVEEIATNVDIPKEMIASKKLIHEVLSFYWKGQHERSNVCPVLMSGWRGELLGDKIKTLLNV